MAKFRPGIVTNISGSMGGTTFVNSPYGPYMRLLTIPVNTKTPAKQTSILRQINVTRLWAKVNPLQHKGWMELAKKFTRIDKSGNKVKVKAIDLFKHINRNLIEINEKPIFDAPKKLFPKKFSSVSVDIIADDILKEIRVFFKPQINKDTKVIIYASPFLKDGMNSTKKHFYKKVSVIDSTFLSGYSIVNDYLSVYKTKKSGTFRIAIKIKPVSRISGLTLEPVAFIEIPVSSV